MAALSIRLPPSHIAAQHLLDIAPQRPWILNYGDADAICLESEAMLRMYKSLGFPENSSWFVDTPWTTLCTAFTWIESVAGETSARYTSSTQIAISLSSASLQINTTQ